MIQKSHSWVYISEAREIRILKECASMIIASLFTVAKIWLQPMCPSTDEWIRKMWYIYTMEYYSAIKKKEMLPFVTMQMNLESILLSEISQIKTNIVWYHLYVESKKLELPYDPAIPLLGIYLDKTIIWKYTRTPKFIAALFTTAKIWKQPKCPSTDECIKKIWYIYSWILLSHKNEIMSFATTWMDLEIIILSEVSQKKKDKYHMVSLICGI